MIKLLIFDLDGTLINSIEDLAFAANYALEKNGFPVHDTDKYYYFVGNGIQKLIERAVPENTDKDVIMKVKNDFSDYYNLHYIDKTKPYDGILELIKELKNKGVKTAVASNKPDFFTKIIVSHFFGDSFDFVQGQKDDIPKKPSPEIVYSILNELKTSKEDAVFIGDSNVDIFTAKNSGLKSIGCLWGFRTEEELQNAGADYIIAHPNEILYILNREES